MVLLRGVEFDLHPEGEALSDHIRREEDFFEAEILDYIRDNHAAHGTIVDVGANIGNHSTYFANFLKYRQILAFEPVPDNFVLLAKNCARYTGVYPFKIAVSNQRDIVSIQTNRSNMGASQVDPNGDVATLAIPIDILGLYDCSLIKIDVEYYEPMVIQGMYNTLRTNHPLILIEDSAKEYAALLPDYELEEGWDEHKTYLYKWKTK